MKNSREDKNCFDFYEIKSYNRAKKKKKKKQREGKLQFR